ncbi:MAG: hypothetical protein KKF62_13470 [Bacteroidetes bacterium]|nr:hypothetical protein [Bacteroidota bacterium]MBU1115525.1 hypothetical protein [Bacteroidota bacterium]MBU1799577.1 hypothetical protein [Bacteroidota bacterium]
MLFTKILFAFLFLSISVFAQEDKTEWEPVFNEGLDRVFIDVSGVAISGGENIYVWSLTEHHIPIEIEGINENIYRTNTYYLFNSRLRKYSILYIIYFDENKNLLASYDYGRNSKIEVYQYNFPILENSIEKTIFDKCVEVISKTKDK